MSILATVSQPSLPERLHLTLRHILMRKRGPIPQNATLVGLSDNLLLDIGVEPAEVQKRANERINPPYRSYVGLAVAAFMKAVRL
jgi:uncharacterized protein YjiS (DUF1127 family)